MKIQQNNYYDCSNNQRKKVNFNAKSYYLNYEKYLTNENPAPENIRKIIEKLRDNRFEKIIQLFKDFLPEEQYNRLISTSKTMVKQDSLTSKTKILVLSDADIKKCTKMLDEINNNEETKKLKGNLDFKNYGEYKIKANNQGKIIATKIKLYDFLNSLATTTHQGTEKELFKANKKIMKVEAKHEKDISDLYSNLLNEGSISWLNKIKINTKKLLNTMIAKPKTKSINPKVVITPATA